MRELGIADSSHVEQDLPSAQTRSIRLTSLDSPLGPESSFSVLSSASPSGLDEGGTKLFSTTNCNTEHKPCTECNSRVCNCASASASSSGPASIPNDPPPFGCSDVSAVFGNKYEPLNASVSTASNQIVAKSTHASPCKASTKREFELTHSDDPCRVIKVRRMTSRDSHRITKQGNTHLDSSHNGYKGEQRSNSDMSLQVCSDVACTSKVLDEPESFVAKRRRLQAQLCRYAPVGRPPGVPS